MDFVYKKLAASQEDDSWWTGQILVEIAAAKELSHLSPECCIVLDEKLANDNTKPSTDIVWLSRAPSEQMKIVLDGLSYPPGASFCFIGYKGTEDGERLVSYIISQVSKSKGTELRSGRNDHDKKDNA